MTGLILAAGSGSRLSESFGKDSCKPLVEIAGKPLIEYSLENLFSAGVDRIYIVVGKQCERIENKIGTEYKGIPIFYAVQKQPVGLINAMASALGEIDDDTVLQLSDEIFVDSISADLKSVFAESGADFLCGVTAESDEEKIKCNYSVEINSDGELISCKEKPSEVSNSFKGTGFCVFSRKCIAKLRKEYDEEKNAPCDLCDFINLLIGEGYRGIITEIAKKEFNINTARDAALAKTQMI